jgi:hypothetical protein
VADYANGGTLKYRVERLERDHNDLESAVRDLNQKIDRLIIVFVTGSIAVTVAIVSATIALLAGGGSA